ncbi:hypothetical protein [Vagococcus sp.]
MKKENLIILSVCLILMLVYLINQTIFKIVLVLAMLVFGIILSIKIRK